MIHRELSHMLESIFWKDGIRFTNQLLCLPRLERIGDTWIGRFTDRLCWIDASRAGLWQRWLEVKGATGQAGIGDGGVSRAFDLEGDHAFVNEYVSYGQTRPYN